MSQDSEYHFREFYIRPEMLESITAYIKLGRPVGGFLTAVICNDLREACGHADEENLANLPAFVAYLHNEAPYNCWGSRENMDAWLHWFEVNATDTLGVPA
jgi:hypothetical protein